MNRSERVYRTQALLAATGCAICMGLGIASLFIGTFSVFLPAVSRDYGWGAAMFPRAMLTTALVNALIGPFAGRLIDRFGARVFLVSGTAAYGVCMLALAEASGDAILLYVIPAFMGIASSFSGPVCFTKVISGWFQRRSGLVLGIVISAAPGAATAIAVFAARELIADAGWRVAYRAFGAVVLAVGVPAALFLIRQAPAASAVQEAVKATAQDVPPAPHSGFATGEALRSREFWLIVAATCLTCGAINGVITQFMMWSSERGMNTAVAAAAVSFYYVIGPVGPVISGFLVDRLRGPRVLPMLGLVPVAGLATVALAPPVFLFPGMALLGLAFSSTMGLLPYLTTRYFGLRSASEIFGIAMGMMALSMSGGAVLLGWAHDISGSYAHAIAAALIGLAVAVVITLGLRPYRFGADEGQKSSPLPGSTQSV